MGTEYKLTNDLVFHYVFGSDRNKKILLSLLNSIMESAGNPLLESVEMLNPINVLQYLDAKLTIMDIKAIDTAGRRYNIEMQIRRQSDYVSRILFYNDRLYVEQLSQTDTFSQLNKAITISLLDFNLFPNNTSVHNVYRFMNIVSKEELTDLKELHFVELNKFDKQKDWSKMSKFEKWLKIIKYGDSIMLQSEEVLPLEPEMKMALKEMVRVNGDSILRTIFELREKGILDERSRMLDAKNEGREQGLEQGQRKGIILANNEMILKFFSKGMDASTISNLMEIEETEVVKVLKENNKL